MNKYQQLLADYLAYRSGLGFRLRKHSETLPGFVAFLEAHQWKRITVEAIVQWARQPTGCDPNWWAERFSMARAFALYCHAILPRTEVPPVGLISVAKHRPAPHIYTAGELKQLLTAAKKLSAGRGLRPWTYATLFGLLSATGLRVHEAVSLNIADVDLQSGVLTIRAAKFNKSRLVPLHSSTTKVLREYATRRNQSWPTTPESAFFVHDSGRRVSYAAAYKTFRDLLHQVGLRTHDQRRGPRLHDLRHTFAVRTLIRWYQSGENVRRLVPVLTTYLGHTSVQWTYWYLSASPDLLAQAGERLSRHLRGARHETIR